MRYIDLTAPWQSPDRIELRAGHAELIVGGSVRATASASELEQLLCVELARDPRVIEEHLLVLVFHDGIWVVPQATPGSNEPIFEQWAPLLRASEQLFALRATRIPRSWRARFLKILQRDYPGLGCFPKRTLPAWPSKRRIAFSDILRPISYEQAIELATAFVKQQGWAWGNAARATPLHATRKEPRRWEVLLFSSTGHSGGARIEIDAQTGAVLRHGHSMY